MENRNNKLKNRNITELLEGLISYKLVLVLLKEAKLKNNLTWLQLTDQEKRTLYHKLKKFSLNITSTNTFEKSQVSTGGIPLTEIDITTMRSLKQNNLYLVGELLDVDGECGGYNLGFAWLSGLIAGESIKEDQK